MTNYKKEAKEALIDILRDPNIENAIKVEAAAILLQHQPKDFIGD